MIINDLHVDPISSWTRIRKLSEGPALPTSMAQNRLVSYMVSQRFPDFPSDVQRFPKKISHGFSIRSRDDSSMVNSPRDFPIISRFPHETTPFHVGKSHGQNSMGKWWVNLRAWWSKRIQPGLPDSRWPAELLCELKLEKVSLKEDTMWIKIQQKLQRWI